MEVSILIVTKNRPDELRYTLNRLKSHIDLKVHEVLVFIDGCSKTEPLVAEFDWVNWEVSEKSISASPARNRVYKKAKGEFFIGFDDDAHPIHSNFIQMVTAKFHSDAEIGILAFQEIKGVFASDEEVLENSNLSKENYFVNDFIGSGFAIRKDVYQQTNGFPTWIDIYGEEPCLSIEVIDLGYKILYTSEIIVNHRVNRENRLSQGRNYFRFEKQLKNVFYYYVVYYPNPTPKIAKLLYHNFKKYALSDFTYFRLYFKSVFVMMLHFISILKVRKPVKAITLQRMKTFNSMKY